jgi:hypothetical protein
VYEHPCAARPELSDALAEIIIQAMALDPARRFDPLDALGRALLPFAGARVRSYYEAVFAEEGPAPESIRPPLPTFDAVSGVITLPPVLTPPRTPRMVVPPSGAAVPTPRPAAMIRDDASTEARTVSYGVRVAPSASDAAAAEQPRRRRAALAVGALLLLGAVGGGVWLVMRGSEANAENGAAPSAAAEATPVTAPRASEERSAALPHAAEPNAAEPRAVDTTRAIVTEQAAPAADSAAAGGGTHEEHAAQNGTPDDTAPDTSGDVRSEPRAPREPRRRPRPAVAAPVATPPPNDPRDIRLTR